MIDILAEKIINLEALLQKAAWVESCLPENTVRRMDARSGWPEYVYDADDKADHEPEYRKIRPTCQEIAEYEAVKNWLSLLGMQRDMRIVVGKHIVWKRAQGIEYGKIGEMYKIATTTVFRWYKNDITILAKKIKWI
jgi:hypothetical protein